MNIVCIVSQKEEAFFCAMMLPLLFSYVMLSIGMVVSLQVAFRKGLPCCFDKDAGGGLFARTAQ